MKKIIFMLILTLSLTHYGFAQDMAERQIEINKFESLYIEGGFRVFLYQVSEPYLLIKAPGDNIIDDINIDSDKRTKKLSIKRGHLNLNRVELHIGFEEFEELHIAGGVKLQTDGYLEMDEFALLLEGGITGNIKMKAESISVVCKGGSVMTLSGVTDNLNVRIAGAGNVKAHELTAKNVTIKVEGAGFGSVYAEKNLDVTIEGVGKVTYKGNPEVKRFVEGLGKVEKY